MPKFISDEEMAKLESQQPKKIISDKEMERLVLTSSKPNPSRSIEGALRGFGKGATFGFLDEIEGGIGALTNAAKYLTGNKKEKDLLSAIKSGYTSERDTSRAYDKQLEQDAPIASTVGSIAATAPMMFASAPLNLVKSAGALGAATGLGNAEGDLKDQLLNTALGGAIGAGTAYGVQSGVTGLRNILDRAKTNAALRSLGATSSDVSKLQYPREVANAAFEKGLIRPGTVGGLSEKAQALQKAAGQTLGNARAASSVQIPADDIIASFNKNIPVKLPGVKTPANAQMAKVLKDVAVLGKQNPQGIPLKTVADLASEYGSQSRNAFGNPKAHKETLDMARKALSTIEDLNLTDRAAKIAKRDYGNLKIINKFLNNASGKGLTDMTGAVYGTAAGMATGNPLTAILGLPAARRQLNAILAQMAKGGAKALSKADSEFLAKAAMTLSAQNAKAVKK